MVPRAKVSLIHRFPVRLNKMDIFLITCCLHTCTHHTNLQMDCDVETAIVNLNENHGYLATVFSDSSAQVFLTAECLLGSPSNTTSLIIALMGVYFSFNNMVYPKPLYPICATFCFGSC